MVRPVAQPVAVRLLVVTLVSVLAGGAVSAPGSSHFDASAINVHHHAFPLPLLVELASEIRALDEVRNSQNYGAVVFLL